MPPKRNNSAKKISAKEKKQITTKLLQISLKLDDYVYKNKSIYAAEAQMYLNEIAACKSQCGLDEHSLQVIEKLERCMTGIINEQQSSNGTDTTNIIEEGTQTYCPSPVYSLPDEDKTMFYENTNITYEFANINDSNVIEDEIEIIDLTIIENEEEHRVSANVEVHNVMSNLSIKETEDHDPLQITAAECSQSILDQYNMSTSYVYETPDKLARTQSSLIINESLNSFNLQSIQKSVLRNVRKINVAKMNESDILAGNGEKSVHCAKSRKNGSLDVTNEKNNTTKRKRVIRKNKCCTNGNTACLNQDKKTKRKNTGNAQNKENKPQGQRKTSNNEKKNKKQITSVTKFVEGKIPEATKDTAGIERNLPAYMINIDFSNGTKTALDNVIKSINADGFQTSPAHSNKVLSIYTKNTENDLSWVENIRYVREITSNEYDSTLTDIGNNFWDNFTLPSNWNDNDFDY